MLGCASQRPRSPEADSEKHLLIAEQAALALLAGTGGNANGTTVLPFWDGTRYVSTLPVGRRMVGDPAHERIATPAPSSPGVHEAAAPAYEQVRPPCVRSPTMITFDEVQIHGSRAVLAPPPSGRVAFAGKGSLALTPGMPCGSDQIVVRRAAGTQCTRPSGPGDEHWPCEDLDEFMVLLADNAQFNLEAVRKRRERRIDEFGL